MDRRGFLSKLSSAAMMGVGTAQMSGPVGASEAPVRSATASNEPPAFKKAIKFHLFDGENPLVEKFRTLASLGFEGVELRCPNDDRERAEVLRARDQTGLSIHGVLNAGNWSQPFSSPDPTVRAKGAETLRAALREASAYGASTVLVIPAVVSEEVSYQEAWERSQKSIRTVLPTAEKLDVTIAFENVWNHFLLGPIEFATYIDAFESEHVGAYLDIGNTITNGWPEHWLRVLGDRVVKVDVKDRTRERFNGRGQAARTKLGDGSCDWAAVRAALRDIGYDGWATAEVQGGGRDRMQEVSERMSQVLSLS